MAEHTEQNSAPAPAARPQIIAPLQAGQSQTKLKKVRYTHDALIDAIIMNPEIRQRELAELFGFTEAWISTVVCSDSFQARLAVRRNDLVGHSMLLNFNERMKRMALKSLDRIEGELDKKMNCDVGIALEGLKIAAKGFGFGNGAQVQLTQSNTQQNFVVQLPGKAASAREWAEAYGATEGGLLANTAASQAVPPMPPAIEALCVEEPMDSTPDLVPVGLKTSDIDVGQE